jgi:hypothetical protein
MSAGSGYLEGPSCHDLTSHVRDVRSSVVAVVVHWGRVDLRPGSVAFQCEHEVCKILRTSNFAITG